MKGLTHSLQRRSRLEWFTLLVSLVLLGGYIAWSLVNERQAVVERERDRLSIQARVIDEHIVQRLDAIRRVLINLRKELPHWRHQPGGMTLANQRLMAFGEALPGVRSLVIFDAKGTILASNRQAFIGSNFNKRHYFQYAQHHPNPEILHLSPPFLAAMDEWVMLLSMSVTDKQGRFNGLVAATLDRELFRATLGSVLYTKDMWAAVAHGDGLQFMMVPERLGQAGMNLAQPDSFFTRHVNSGTITNVLSGRVYSTGENRMMALHTIQPLSLHMDNPLIIAVGREIDSIFKRWKREVTMRSTLFVLLALTSSFALYALQRTHRKAERDAIASARAIRMKNSELEALNEQLHALAMVDGLTGVANRRRFDEVFENEWRRSRRDKTPLALLMIDIDHFKQFNDNHGHQSGDKCLQKIAQVLQEGIGRSTDLVARYGGEEFICLLTESDINGAAAKAESLRKAVEELHIPHEGSSSAFYVTISIGAASRIPDENSESQQLIADADDALYKAKHNGRNRVYTAVMPQV